MRVFFDENMPRPLRQAMSGHEIAFVEERSWKGKDNGALLDLVEADFDVLITSDSSLAFQQSFTGRDLSVIVVPTNNLTVLKANAAAILSTLDHIATLDHPVMVTISRTGRRTIKHLDDPTAVESEIDPAGSFRP